MANRRTTFDKLQRERARKAKAAAKRDRRMDRAEATPASPGDAAEPVTAEAGRDVSAAQLLEAIELIHRQFEAKQIGMDEFEQRKAELLARLPIE
jgi:hypothetical protein